jgi:hypothetical protein
LSKRKQEWEGSGELVKGKSGGGSGGRKRGIKNEEGGKDKTRKG